MTHGLIVKELLSQLKFIKLLTTPLLQLRDVPGRKTPSVPQPLSSGTLPRSSRVSGTAATPFHSTTSTGFFSLEDVSSSSEVSGLEEMKALRESNKVVMERLQRNEQPTPSTEWEESQDRPRPADTPQSEAMTETRQDLLLGGRHTN